MQDSLCQMEKNKSLLQHLQQKVGVNLTENLLKKHPSARELHQHCEQLVARWNKLQENLNDTLENVQLKVCS